MKNTDKKSELTQKMQLWGMTLSNLLVESKNRGKKLMSFSGTKSCLDDQTNVMAGIYDPSRLS